MVKLAHRANLAVLSQGNSFTSVKLFNIIQNFIEFEWSESDSNVQKSIVPNPLNSNKFYDVYKLSHTIKFVIPVL